MEEFGGFAATVYGTTRVPDLWPVWDALVESNCPKNTCVYAYNDIDYKRVIFVT